MKVFISYVREKDEFNAVTEFRIHFANELRGLLPGSTVFQDIEDIKPGDPYPQRLAHELADADLLLILVSPSWLSRPWCRREYELFIKDEANPHRSVLPVLWVKMQQLDAPGDDVIARELGQLQYDDWRELRHESWTNPDIR